MEYFLILPMLLVIVFLGYSIKVIKRHWIDKKGFSSGTEFTAQSIYEKFLNKQQRQGVQHIKVMKEQKIEDDSGDYDEKSKNK